MLLVVVYLRSADSAVVAALSALLLACCYRVAVRWWPVVALLLALARPYWWPAGAGVVAVAVHAWPLVVACCWPAAGARCPGGGRWSGRWPDAACRIYNLLLSLLQSVVVSALQHGTATLPGGTYRGRSEIFWAEFQFQIQPACQDSASNLL